MILGTAAAVAALLGAALGTTNARAADPAQTDCTPLALEPRLAAIAPTVETFTLDNGLRVLMAPRPEARTATVRIAYDVGSRDDPSGRGGLAHFVEHLMFKGSPAIADGEHFRRVRDVGGRVNAFTDWDVTEYVDTAAPGALRRILESEVDRMRGLRLLEASLSSQRAAIQEEMALRVTNVPYARPAADFLSDLWKGTPYGHAPTGSDAELAAVDVSDVERFHADYYGPANAVLVLVGGFDPSAARPTIESLFESVPRGRPRPAASPVVVDPTPIRETLEDELAPFPVYGIAWHAPGSRDPDAIALSLVDDLLLGDRDARLARAIRGKLVFDAYSLSFALRDAGLVNFVFAPRTFASFRRIRKQVDRVVEELTETGPDEAELCRAIRAEQAARLAALETGEGLAGALGRGLIERGDPRSYEGDLRALAALDAGSVREASERVLGRPPSTIVIMPTGAIRWLKPILEVLPDGVGASLEQSLL